MSKQKNIFLRVDSKQLVAPVFMKVKPTGDKEITLDRIDFLREVVAAQYRAKTKRVREISKEYYNAQKAFNKAEKKLDEAKLRFAALGESNIGREEIEMELYRALDKFAGAEVILEQIESMGGFNRYYF